MKIIKPYAKIVNVSVSYDPCENVMTSCDNNALGFIEWCGRISHRSEDKQTSDSYQRFIKAVVIEHGDWSIVEHVSASVDAIVDRGITHEWVRHRLFSYTQESTRFVNYEKKMAPSFIYPQVDVECEYCLAGNEVQTTDSRNYWHTDSDPNEDGAECKYNVDWLRGITMCETSYKRLLQDKWRPQEARSVFPNALASRMISTANLRIWRHFFIMRTCAEAHPQMRQITIPLLKEFQETFPILFDDIVPNEKQAVAMRKAQ